MRILPGSTIGILGGGQLGRMTALAARTLGYDVHALDPDLNCPARSVLDRCITAAFDDAFAAADLARRCQVVTFEIEKIASESLHAAARYAPVRPSPAILEMVQDRARQKRWLEKRGFPLGAWREAATLADLAEAARALGTRVFAKACQGGYDGRGQAVLSTPEEAESAWELIGAPACVVEQGLDLEAELSVLVARNPSGDIVVYPPALNHHERQILEWSELPGPLPPEIVASAQAIARSLSVELSLEGLLAVEMFLVKDGRLLVNELAPRPHNTYHAADVACLTSQFEQHVRSVCDLPLGSVEVVRSAAIVNLLGDLWGEATPAFDAALEVPGTRLHLYGKRIARPGRKMGHLTAVGATSEEALSRAREARDRLLGGARPPKA